MKHIFASGEEIYKKNIKELEQGTFIAKYINYEDVSEDTVFEAVGSIDEKPVSVEFTIAPAGFGDLKFRYTLNIMMQSDLMAAEWTGYKVNYL